MKTFRRGFILLIMTAAFLSGCGSKKTVSDYDRIHTRLSEMTSYKAKCSVTYCSDLSKNTYETIQIADSEGRYRIEALKPDETNGVSVLFDGDIIWLYNPAVKSKIQAAPKDSDKRREIILFTFLKNEGTSGEEASVSAASVDGEKYVVLEARIPGESEEYSSEKLFVDIKSGAPERLEIYNSKGRAHVIEEFDDFEFNPELSGNEFKIASMLGDDEVK